MNKIYITVKDSNNPKDSFFVSWVDVDFSELIIDWDLTNNISHALEVNTIDIAKAIIACIKASKIINGYTFKIIELIKHD